MFCEAWTNFQIYVQFHLAAILGSQSSPPLSAERGGGRGPPCHIDKQKVGTSYIASYTQPTGLLGQLFHEVLRLLM
jgi:hypothetical protein